MIALPIVTIVLSVIAIFWIVTRTPQVHPQFTGDTDDWWWTSVWAVAACIMAITLAVTDICLFY